MKAEELNKGRKLADKALEWHRSTMPFPDEYTEEDIPKLVRWLKAFAFPELERHDDTAKANPNAPLLTHPLEPVAQAIKKVIRARKK